MGERCSEHRDLSSNGYNSLAVIFKNHEQKKNKEKNNKDCMGRHISAVYVLSKFFPIDIFGIKIERQGQISHITLTDLEKEGGFLSPLIDLMESS